MSTKPSALPDLSLLLSLEELDQKRFAVQERLKEIPSRRDSLNAEASRLDRAWKEKEQSIAAKEKSLSALELDLKTSQTQEAEKKVKLNTVKTQKEYDAIKSEIDLTLDERGKLEEHILLLMDEITELKDYLKREKQATDAKKKELKAQIDALAADERALMEESQKLTEDAQTRVQSLPDDVHRQYTRLRASLPAGRILSKLVPLDNEFSCSSCNSPVAHQIVIDIKRGFSLHHCEICHRLLYP